jgi:hypothetical protein
LSEHSIDLPASRQPKSFYVQRFTETLGVTGLQVLDAIDGVKPATPPLDSPVVVKRTLSVEIHKQSKRRRSDPKDIESEEVEHEVAAAETFVEGGSEQTEEPADQEQQEEPEQDKENSENTYSRLPVSTRRMTKQSLDEVSDQKRLTPSKPKSKPPTTRTPLRKRSSPKNRSPLKPYVLTSNTNRNNVVAKETDKSKAGDLKSVISAPTQTRFFIAPTLPGVRSTITNKPSAEFVQETVADVPAQEAKEIKTVRQRTFN